MDKTTQSCQHPPREENPDSDAENHPAKACVQKNEEAKRQQICPTFLTSVFPVQLTPCTCELGHAGPSTELGFLNDQKAPFSEASREKLPGGVWVTLGRVPGVGYRTKVSWDGIRLFLSFSDGPLGRALPPLSPCPWTTVPLCTGAGRSTRP